MNVEVITATQRPMDVISAAAGCCYGKSNYSEKRVRTCYKAGHMSVFEHASATFRVSGISRACSHQLVRHRVGVSFSQQSQRYCKVDVDGDWFVMPPSFDAGEDDPTLTMERDEYFYMCMYGAARNYQDALKAGIKPEDARYLLPEATKTEIVVSMNVRELFHFLDLRESKAAQWEIRELARAMVDALSAYDGQWLEVMNLRRCAR
jgi:thymidylate synthase (FAD)